MQEETIIIFEQYLEDTRENEFRDFLTHQVQQQQQTIQKHLSQINQYMGREGIKKEYEITSSHNQILIYRKFGGVMANTYWCSITKGKGDH